MDDVFQLGEYRVEPGLGRITGAQGSVKLEPKTMAVLLHLVELPGQVVDRRELLETVWKDTFVTEEVLSHAIWQLRKALGDDARDPAYIETIPRRGYRLIASVADPAADLAGEADAGPGWRPAPGEEIPGRPKWCLERKLGDGGFGEVWLARREKSGARRVYKFCSEEQSLWALQREVTLFRLLKEELGVRDDIVRILDWNFDHVPYFIESEYASGGSASEWAAERGGLEKVSLATRLELVAQAAVALAAAHSVGVLHKDVKPANILIYEDRAGRPQVRLSDFGIGRIVDRARLERAGITQAGLTETGSPAERSSDTGTRLYMAPEVIAGKAATLQADLYALGVVLYQMVIADFTRPLAPGWERDIEDELLLEDVAELVDGVPERRPASARAVAVALRALESRRQERRAARRAKEAQERSLRRRRLAGAAAIVATLLAGILGWQERRTAAEARRANREAETAGRVAEFLVELFEAADPFQPVDRSVSAREIVDRGARRIRSELEEEPEVRATLMATLGEVYTSLGLYDQATALLEPTLELRRQVLGSEHPAVAKSFDLMADLLRKQERFDDAEALFREALDLHRSAGRHLEAADSLRGVGLCQWGRGEAKLAEASLGEALSLFRDHLGRQHLKVADCLNDLGLAVHAVGDAEGAEALYREALAVYLAHHGDMHPVVAMIRQNIAVAAAARGDLEVAESLYRQALEVFRRTLGDEHPEVPALRANLGSLLFRKGDFAAAESVYREALAQSRQLLGDEHPSIAFNLLLLGRSVHEQGDVATAEPLLREALTRYRKLYGDRHLGVVRALDALGRTLLDRGDVAAAEAIWNEALDLRRELLGDDHVTMAQSLEQVAEIAARNGRRQRAEDLYRRAETIRAEADR